MRGFTVISKPSEARIAIKCLKSNHTDSFMLFETAKQGLKLLLCSLGSFRLNLESKPLGNMNSTNTLLKYLGFNVGGKTHVVVFQVWVTVINSWK